MRIGAVSEQGKEALLSLVEAPHWFGEICLFDGQPRTHDAYAVGPCTLVNIPQATLLKLLDEHPVYWRHLALLMSQKLRLTFINLEQLSLLPAPARLAHRLLMIAEGYGELDAPRRVLQLPQEQLASMLSLSRQTTNQILKDLQGQGIIGLGMARSRSSMPRDCGHWPHSKIWHRSIVGVSLLAIAVCQPTHHELIHRYREQAHSYRGNVRELTNRDRSRNHTG